MNWALPKVSFFRSARFYLTKTNPAELTFRKLYALSDELTEAKAVWTKDSASLSHIILGHDRRCPWGGCFQSDSNECPGISHGSARTYP